MFNKDSRICFIGDSITHSGLQIRRIYEYFRKEQKLPLKIFNCGVSGDNATNALLRLDDTLFIHNPTDVVIAFGVNDVGIHLYKVQEADENNINERRRRIDTCAESIRKIAEKCYEKNIKVIFCTPMTFDEFQTESYNPFNGVMGALSELSAKIRFIAKELNAPVVDYNIHSMKFLLKLIKTDDTIYVQDRTHPTKDGYEFMARVFLNNSGFDVSIPDTYAELKAITALPFDEWENERYMMERKALSDYFVRYCLFSNVSDESLIPDLCKKKLETETWDVIINELKAYEANRIIAPEYKEKLYKFTEDVKIN